MQKEYLLKKWLNNELSDTEAKSFDMLEDAELYNEIIEEAQRFSGNTNAQVESFELLNNKLNSDKNTSTNWIKVVSSIAAIFVIGFAIFTLINKNQISSLKTVLAQNETVTLPDNSIVNLNELSELDYNSSDWDENRSINLKGEAFFDVEKGKQFDVNTQFGKVSVLGTEFNVLSRDGVFKVSCYEGLVQVTYENNEIKLPAGTEFILDSGVGVKSSIVIAEPYWLKNMSVFENATLKDVIAEFENQYDVKIHYTSDTPMNFTGAFEHNNLEKALKSITQPLNLTYIVQNTNEVIIRNGQN
ncbi:FecR family protein [Psychroserpens sp.]|uniref:FecR family protein n=1 Tax=Psychroserpens sp. TaxID=2020870 RepID=UPI002B2681CC|nr:FecR family protein [Psychroserpens sp.]